MRDPHHLPRWWPRVTRVEDVGADAFTEVMTHPKGKVVRADFSVVAGGRATRTLTWAQNVQGTPFARVLSSAETEVRLLPAGTDTAAAAPEPATEVTIELRQALTGFFPPASAASSSAVPRRRRSRRPSTAWSGSVAERREPATMRWWGWGDPEHPSGAARPRARLPARARSASPSARARRWRSEQVRLPASALADAVARPAAGSPRRGRCARRPRRARAARRRQGLPGPRAAARRASPRAPRTPCSTPRATSSCGRCSSCAPRARSRWCRSAAGRAWSAAWRRWPGEHGAVLALDMGAHGRAARPRPRVGHGDRAGRACARPRSSASSARAGSRSGTSRSPSSTSRSAAAPPRARPGRPRPATARSRRWCSACAWRRRPTEHRAAGAARDRGGPRPAPAAGRLGGHARGDQRARAARAPRAAPSALYEGVFFEDFAAGVQALRALAREHVLPDVARLSDEQETQHVAGARRAAA